MLASIMRRANGSHFLTMTMNGCRTSWKDKSSSPLPLAPPRCIDPLRFSPFPDLRWVLSLETRGQLEVGARYY